MEASQAPSGGRCKVAFPDNLAILPVWRSEDDCVPGRSRCIGKKNKVNANKAWFNANYSPVVSARDTVYDLRQLVGSYYYQSLYGEVSIETVVHWKSSSVGIQVRHLIRSGPPGR